MKNIVLFAGTTEGRKLCEALKDKNINIFVSVATEYGKELVPEGKNIFVFEGRKNADEMAAFVAEKEASLVIDATHPYAEEATKEIKAACEKTNTEYLRLLRDEEAGENESCLCFSDNAAAAKYLDGETGNLLSTLGSKELCEYKNISGFKERFFARMLPLSSSLAEAEKAGLPAKNLICMQGPFSQDMNEAMLKACDAKFLVTKDTGAAGGFFEKLDAAKKLGIKTVVIKRPQENEGLSFDACLALIKTRFEIKTEKKVSIVACGMGSLGTRTFEADRAFREAELIIGAKRLLLSLADYGKAAAEAILPGEIAKMIEASDAEKIAVAMSGDTGFYSGTKKLLPMLKNFETEVLPGMSSVVYFCGKLKTSWDDAVLISAHGRSCNFVSKIKKNKKVIMLTGGEMTANEIIRVLSENGLADLSIAVGENLSYENEMITRGTVSKLLDRSFCSLAVLMAENPKVENAVTTHGLPDSAFLRAEVPMTKQEVRAVTLSKLELTKNAVCYDIGAGTGSVSLEMADCCEDGFVYAVEQKEAACELIEKNMRHLGITNVKVIRGKAPDSLEGLPAPTHAFIGGSSGNLKTIIETLLAKNPKVRIVINTVTAESFAETMNCLETLPLMDEEIVNVSVSRGAKLGRYHLMTAQNPVYVISCNGGEKNA